MTVLAPEKLLRSLFARAVETADPILRIRDALPKKPDGRVLVIGAGKASARMAEAVEAAWGPCEGLVITRYGYARTCQGIEIVEAAHPVPDENGARATRRMLEMLEDLGSEDFVLALISGGGSALLTDPAGEISFNEKQKINAALLASGAPITQMNIVRKHLSRVKGGQLAAAAYPARMLTLMISDVPGDDPASIASGPTVGDSSTSEQALKILRDYGVDIPDSIAAFLATKSQVVAPGDKCLSRVENKIIAAPQQSLDAAAEMARSAGIQIRFLGDALEGEARDLGRAQALLARQIQSELVSGDAPILLLSGGECTVTRRGNGTGGPNAEFVLSATIALAGSDNIYAIACDTDGVDGAADVAGAYISSSTITKALSLGLEPSDFLKRNDSHSFFEAIGDQIVTGPTLTNVNDFRAVLIEPVQGQ